MIHPLVIDRRNPIPLEKSLEAYPEGIIFPVDKPYRWTSSDVVRKIKFILRNHFNTKNIKIGHAGTLDPLATGLLIVCLGKACKISEALQAEKKEYIAEFTLGATTPSFDREHPVDSLYPAEHITKEDMRKAAEAFVSQTEQMPPAYSAKYVNGTRSYYLARNGEQSDLKPAAIKIYSSCLLAEDDPLAQTLTRPSYGEDALHNTFVVKKRIASEENNPVVRYTENSLLDPSQLRSLPRAVLKIECSKGTYIRSMARDFGATLSSGAFMSALRRTASGGFRVEDALDVKDYFDKL
ncbi:MAG: tRNA pseudouridine(55) synthase TruB [Bacteroidales bacterium]|nr:tRNA pseudouridine(55) synthase TruB [Bacteroidales bacterium]MBP5517778.1 tRNA pseudouridine(55) synthase TruB [Bacteroidales bacterium]